MDFPSLEEKILKNWRQSRAFEKSVTKRPKSRIFTFYEGPPTANGKPGLHHVEARSFKDVVCRYKTMRGFRVERRAGWDTHGLPVEIQVEKELGFTSKDDIERYGIAKFNEKCKQSVWQFKQEWERLTQRMGFWIDMDNPYITYEPAYMETLWWIIAEAWKKDLLYEGHRVMPYCPRCGTSLSSHEVAQGYANIVDETVTVKYRITSDDFLAKHHLPKENTYLLVWTTTPWTLPGNVAVAVNPKIDYVAVGTQEEWVTEEGGDYPPSKEGDVYIVARDRRDEVMDGPHSEFGSFKGKDLELLTYEPIFDSLKNEEGEKYQVVLGDFVTTEEGTGLVHMAPMYGEDDYAVAEKYNLPRVHTVDEDGTFNKRVPQWKGKRVKDLQTDASIIDWLKKEGALYKQQSYKHTYPFCWRCGNALLYYAMHSWFMKMSALKNDLIAANKKITWVPDYIKEGRFGEWLREVKDWGFSRSRYWGTPLPVWRCDNASCGRVQAVGSRQDLAATTQSATTFVVMRHGEAESNTKHVLSGKVTDKHNLTERGKKQVHAAAKKIAKQGGVDVIVTSPILRTKETASVLAEELDVPVHEDTHFTENNAGVLEGRSTREYDRLYRNSDVDFAAAPAKGESAAAIRARLREGMAALEKKYPGKRVLIVTHGDPTWLLRSVALGLTNQEASDQRAKLFPKNGEVIPFAYGHFPYNADGEVDLHRPYVDAITFACKKCDNGTMKRDEYVVDVWFDSGAMPFAQAHYPFENKQEIESGTAYPADYIVEAIDQTRGWFYTLLAVSALTGFAKKAPPYRTAVSLGHVLDEHGKKMSKSKGNIVDPFHLADTYGMDAVRWYFFTVNGPGDVKRFAERDVAERQRKFVATLWNSLVFLQTYAPTVKAPKAITSKHVLDAWMAARLKEVAAEVQIFMDEYHIVEAARLLDAFVMQDVSNWYVRRSRARLQRPASAQEKKEAAGSLAFTLSELAKLAAPFTPFIAEAVWQAVNATEKKSVHWEDYPKEAKLLKREQKTLADMANVRAWAEVALRLRASAGQKVRQPLATLVVPEKLSKELAVILQEELNVKEVVYTDVYTTVYTKSGWVTADTPTGTLALNIEVSRELEREGQVRDIVRRIQDMRKSFGLKPNDKVIVEYSLPKALRGNFTAYEQDIARDVNAKQVREGSITNESAYDAFATLKLNGKNEIKLAFKKA
ncbi:MAG: class I tRNA ligase family protein [Candidatus Spechtbacterales bacterium]